MSTQASEVKKPHRAKKSKKQRKHGRGVRKVEKSRFRSYAAIFAASRERKLQRMKTREARLARRREKKLSAAGGTADTPGLDPDESNLMGVQISRGGPKIQWAIS